MNRLALYVTFEGKEESVLATSNEDTAEKQKAELEKTRSEWMANGEAKYLNAKYRIGPDRIR